MSSYQVPIGEIRLGDIFEASHLYDIHIREDSTAIPGYEVPAALAEMVGKRMVGRALPPEPFEVHSPAFPPRHGQDFVRAHGSARRAVILSDNCAIATAFGYDDREHPLKAGRLIFAPIADASKEEIETAIKQSGYGRFALEAGGFFKGGIVELRRAFMVEIRAIDPEQRTARLDLALAELLEIRWQAYSARRGPDVFDKNAHKLKNLLARPNDPGAKEKEAAAMVAETLSIAWRLEGRTLEDAAAAWDKNRDGSPVITELIQTLNELEAAARDAAGKLAAYSTVP
jgi:hypothetical protein